MKLADCHRVAFQRPCMLHATGRCLPVRGVRARRNISTPSTTVEAGEQRCLADAAVGAAPIAEQHYAAGRTSWQRLGHAMRAAAPALALTALGVAACLALPDAASAAAAAAAPPGASQSPLAGLLSLVLHLDKHLSAMIATHGTATYAILAAIVFCETGLVLTPFLPGDSLLFAAGAFAGMGKLNVGYLLAIFITSAIIGDAVNYAIGNKLGKLAIERKIIKPEYLTKTEAFYAKYGGKTVVLARFVPIVRTFAPFVAGVGSMAYSQFALYNVAGALIWSLLFVGAGFFFGNLPFVQHNFTLVVLAIVVVSIVPVALEVINASREASSSSGSAGSTDGPSSGTSRAQ